MPPLTFADAMPVFFPPQRILVLWMVTVNLTATEEDQGLYVYHIEKNEYIEVRGKSGSSFMYEILAIRKGYLNSKVEIDN